MSINSFKWKSVAVVNCRAAGMHVYPNEIKNVDDKVLI